MHVHPGRFPPHLFFCSDPDDPWHRGADRLHEKLAALGVEHECDLETRAGGHSWQYFNHLAERAVQLPCTPAWNRKAGGSCERAPVFNHVIVGGGSAGCVLAARLSEDSSARVLLLEAGGADWRPRIHIPAAFFQLFKTSVDWQYYTEEEPHLGGRQLYWPRGRRSAAAVRSTP